MNPNVKVRDLREYLNGKKKSHTEKARQNRARTDSASSSSQTDRSGKEVNEAVMIALGLIKKPRKIIGAEKREEKVHDEIINSNGSDEVSTPDGEKNVRPSPAKVYNKDFFPLSGRKGQDSERQIIKTSSSKLQERLRRIKHEAQSVNQDAVTQPKEDVRTFVFNPEAEEFRPPSKVSQATTTSSTDDEKISQRDANRRNALSKLTRDQQLGLLTVAALPEHCFQQSFDYFIEYYKIIEQYLDVAAVCDFLNYSGIQFVLPVLPDHAQQQTPVIIL